MNIPDVEGFLLGRAMELLNDKRNINASILVTGPPRLAKNEYDDVFRVLRVRALSEDRLELVICDPEA